MSVNHVEIARKIAIRANLSHVELAIREGAHVEYILQTIRLLVAQAALDAIERSEQPQGSDR